MERAPMKRPKKLIKESEQQGTRILNLETGEEVVIPYGNSADPDDVRYAGMGPGYHYRIYRALQALGWEIEPEDFGSIIANLIYQCTLPWDDSIEDFQTAFEEREQRIIDLAYHLARTYEA